MNRCEKERAQSLWKVFCLWHTEEAGLEAMSATMARHYGHEFEVGELRKVVVG